MDRDAQNHRNIKFLISCGDDEYEEIIAYNELSALIQQQQTDREQGKIDKWAFQSILDHQGPLRASDPDYKGSSYNVLVHWEDGSKTWEPLNMIAKDDGFTVAKYAAENDLIDTPGWKFLRRYTRNIRLIRRMLIHGANKRAIRFKFGVQIPRTAKEAFALDKENGNTFWEDAMKMEISQLNEFETLTILGPAPMDLPPGYKLIRAHMVFDVKQSGKQKARLVAGGHLTDPPKESCYSRCCLTSINPHHLPTCCLEWPETHGRRCRECLPDCLHF
jgi:hypothetical protein